MSARVYMDWNATAPLRPEAREAMIAAMDVVGNPSSVHAEGRLAKGIVEKAREQVSSLLSCDKEEITFTSGATEAISTALKSGNISCADIEHEAVRSNRKNGDVLVVNSDGILIGEHSEDGVYHYFVPDRLKFSKHGCEIAAIQAANSETGILQDYHDFGGTLNVYCNFDCFVDAVQAVGKIPFSFTENDKYSFTSFCISSHKIGGPKGVGCLIRDTLNENMALIKGGGQEQGRRSGTENVIGIAGFGAAAEAAARDLADGVWDEVAELRDYMEDRIAEIAHGAIFFGKNVKRLPNTSNFAVPGWKGETQVMQMDLAGYAISAGSACSSGKVKTSRVLKAMGFDDITASSAIRVSLGPTNTKDQIDGFVSTWAKSYNKFRAKAA